MTEAEKLVRSLALPRGYLSISQVASAAGIHRTTLADALAGRRWPSRRSRARLAAALGLDPKALDRLLREARS